MKAKIGVLVGVVLFCALLGVFWANKDDAPVILPKPSPPPVSTTPVVQEPEPVSLEDCYARAEQKYKNYLDAYAQKQPNAYGQETYNLTQDEWDKITVQRGEDYHKCALKFN